MSSKSEIDSSIVDAIKDALEEAGLLGTKYATKFERRLVNKLTGQFEESDLTDLIAEMPIEGLGVLE